MDFGEFSRVVKYSNHEARTGRELGRKARQLLGGKAVSQTIVVIFEVGKDGQVAFFYPVGDRVKGGSRAHGSKGLFIQDGESGSSYQSRTQQIPVSHDSEFYAEFSLDPLNQGQMGVIPNEIDGPLNAREVRDVFGVFAVQSDGPPPSTVGLFLAVANSIGGNSSFRVGSARRTMVFFSAS